MNALAWRVPGKRSTGALLKRLGKRLGTVEAGRVALERVHLDTFDGRLWRRGEVVEAEREVRDEPGPWRLRRRGPRDGASRGVLPVAALPRVAADVPPGRWRDLLADSLDVRTLIPRAWLQVDAHRLEVRDGRDKVVLRVDLETVEGHPAGPAGVDRGTAHPLGRWVLLRPVRGYDGALADALSALEAEGLEPLQHDPFEMALSAVGTTPDAYSGKIEVELDPDQRADVATRQVLAAITDVLLANVEGTRVGDDPEFLHDLRVSVRRIRSLLGQLKGVFPEAVVARFAPRWKWVGEVTGPARDLDVHALELDALIARVPADQRGHLEPLRPFLAARREAAHAALVEALDGPAWRELVEDWQAFLRAEAAARPTAPRARQPIAGVARQRIRKVYARVLREGRAITDDSPAEPVHDLRKTCKKLRYLLEVHASVLPPDATSRAVRHLKKLQSLLGTFNDQDVQIHALTAWSGALMQAPGADARTLLALGVLVDGLRRAQVDTRAHFAETFAAFDHPKVAKRFDALVAPPEDP